jgi:hypothetical protein
MQVISHPIRESFEKKHGKIDDLRSFTHGSAHSGDWISVTTTLFNSNDGLVYLGLTDMSGDIFYAMDPATGKSECLDYLSIRAKNEVKIHRSLQIAPDGKLCAGSAGLIDVRTRDESPGGQIWIYDPETRKYRVLGIPAEHDYVQHVTYDFERQLVYGATYPVPFFFVYDMTCRVTRRKTYIGAYPHRTVIADDGTVWTGYGMSADIANGLNMMMSYNPGTDEITWHEWSLPAVGQAGDNCQLDDAVNLGDGYLYFATVNGGFSRMDQKSGELEWLGKPARGMRICGIDEGSDGLIYLATGANYGLKGDDGLCGVWSFDRKTGHFANHGVLRDQNGDECASVHSLTIGDDGRIWIGETDNGKRSGFLWECRL